MRRSPCSSKRDIQSAKRSGGAKNSSLRGVAATIAAATSATLTAVARADQRRATRAKATTMATARAALRSEANAPTADTPASASADQPSTRAALPGRSSSRRVTAATTNPIPPATAGTKSNAYQGSIELARFS